MKNKLWGVWELEEKIGTGSFGTVYKAKKTELGKDFYAAIKHISFPKNDEELEEIKRKGNVISIDSIRDYYKDTIDDLIKEIEIMYELRANENIVDYQDHLIVEKDNKLGYDVYIRMELLTPLDKYIENKKVTEELVTKIGIDICQALNVCKTHNLLHRDIKPANIFVDEKGTFKLGDFGVAKKLEKTTLNLSKKGTFNYMAPEIYKGNLADIRSDIYSLGIVMYRLLNNNRAPFIDKDMTLVKASDNETALLKRMSGELIPPIEGISQKLQTIIYTACSYDKKNRYDDPEIMRKDLLKSDDKYERKFSDEYDKTVSIYEDYDKTVSIYEDCDKTISIYDKEKDQIKEVNGDLSNILSNSSDEELREKIKRIIEEERENKNIEIYDVEAYFEKLNKGLPLLSFIISLILAFLLLTQTPYISYGNDIQYNVLKMMSEMSNFSVENLILFIVCMLILIAFIMSIAGKKHYNNSKKLYFINIILLGIQLYLFYFKGFNINILYLIYLTSNFIFLILPFKYNLKLEKLKVEKSQIEYYKNRNKSLKKIYDNYKENKKINVISILIISIILIGTFIPVPEQSNKNVGENFVKVVTDYINLRDDATYSSNIIGRVYQGETYNIISYQYNENVYWYEIETNFGKRGFITNGYENDYLEVSNKTLINKYLEVTAEYINVREKPTTNSNILGKVYRNEKYEILEIKESDNYNWYKIIYNNKESYIANPKNGQYIKIIGG